MRNVSSRVFVGISYEWLADTQKHEYFFRAFWYYLSLAALLCMVPGTYILALVIIYCSSWTILLRATFRSRIIINNSTSMLLGFFNFFKYTARQLVYSYDHRQTSQTLYLQRRNGSSSSKYDNRVRTEKRGELSRWAIWVTCDASQSVCGMLTVLCMYTHMYLLCTQVNIYIYAPCTQNLQNSYVSTIYATININNCCATPDYDY